MRMTNIMASAALAAALASSGAQAASLITNGSFEDTTNFVDQGNDTMTVGPGSTAITGWTVTAGSLAWIGPSNPFGVTASDGSYSLDLTGYRDAPPYAGVTQTISTVNGGHYVLTFDLGTQGNSPSAINAAAGTANQTFTTTAQAGFGWQTETLAFTASGTSTTVSLLGQTESNGNYIGLDNVSVTCTSACTVSGAPEPASWALMLVGFGGLGVMLRSRRRHANAPA